MKIGFIGVGNLGEKAVRKLSKNHDLYLSDPIKKEELEKISNGYFSLEETINSCEVIFFTIKPNMLEELFFDKDLNLKDKIFISLIILNDTSDNFFSLKNDFIYINFCSIFAVKAE